MVPQTVVGSTVDVSRLWNRINNGLLLAIGFKRGILCSLKVLHLVGTVTWKHWFNCFVYCVRSFPCLFSISFHSSSCFYFLPHSLPSFPSVLIYCPFSSSFMTTLPPSSFLACLKTRYKPVQHNHQHSAQRWRWRPAVHVDISLSFLSRHHVKCRANSTR
jgi:hypothetical protein